jgi:hypothetical protein
MNRSQRLTSYHQFEEVTTATADATTWTDSARNVMNLVAKYIETGKERSKLELSLLSLLLSLAIATTFAVAYFDASEKLSV